MRESYHDYMGRKMREDREISHLRFKLTKYYRKIHKIEERLKELNES